MTLKSLRTRNGLTLKQVAERMGVTLGYIAHLEKGRRRVTLETAEKLSYALHEPRELILECAKETDFSPAFANSWLTGLKMNGLPMYKAFKYHAATLNIDWENRIEVARAIAEFTRENIVPSLIRELDTNEELLTTLIAISRK